MSVKLARTSVAAVLASTLLLAGCNSDDKSKDAADKASSSQSTQASESGSTGGDTGSGSAHVLTKADYIPTILAAMKDARSFKVKATVDMTVMTLTMNSEMEYLGNKVRIHAATAPGSAQQVEMVLADGVTYFQVAGLPIPNGKWVKVDPKDPTVASSPFASLASAADPERALRAFGDPESVDHLGSETLEGQQTEHYRVTIAVKKYAANMNLPAEAASQLPETMTMDMWVDGQNRPVKLHQEFDVQGRTATTDSLYSDYGTAVKITVPPESDTVPFSQVSSQLSGS